MTEKEELKKEVCKILREKYIDKDHPNLKAYNNDHYLIINYPNEYDWLIKAMKWDALGKRIGNYYAYIKKFNRDADLSDIGEAAATAFGYIDYGLDA